VAKKLEQGGEKSTLHRPKVLIVDDEITLCNLFKKALTEEGYDVLTAENGEKAIDVVRKDAPELVLLDIRMPGIGGMDVLRHLKAIKSNLLVPY
jgi:two-component system, response regulator, stage 0 sporulation protein F